MNKKNQQPLSIDVRKKALWLSLPLTIKNEKIAKEKPKNNQT